MATATLANDSVESGQSSQPAHWGQRFLSLGLAFVYLLVLSLLAIVAIGLVLVLLALLNGHFAVAFLVGVLGAIGGSLAAVDKGAGILSLPSYDHAARSVNLGSLQQLMFGAGGAFIAMMITPGASESALDRSELYAGSLRSLVGVSTAAAAAAGSTNTQNGMDLFEIASLAILGGFAGQWLVANSAMKFVSQETMQKELKKVDASLSEVKENVEATISTKVDDVKRQRELDHDAIGACNDQLDMSSEPPSAIELRDKLMAASDTVHTIILLRAREAFHRIREDSFQRQRLSPLASGPNASPDVEKTVREYQEDGSRRLSEICERLVPILRCLIDRDEKRRYSGARLLLAQSLAVLARKEEAQQMFDAALAIEKELPRTADERQKTLRAYGETANSFGLTLPSAA